MTDKLYGYVAILAVACLTIVPLVIAANHNFNTRVARCIASTHETDTVCRAYVGLNDARF